MSTKPASKLNQLLQSLPKGTVMLASWLVDQGYSHDLQQKYIRSQWLTPIGKGAQRCSLAVRH
nr:AbiEi antitoxin N-terminal domain-containing protein [Bacteroidota bacterium]